MSDKISQVQIFGERNSGTNYISKLVHENFKGISITNDFGWKHGDMGWAMRHYNDQGKLVKRMALSSNDPSVKTTLFIVVFRNPVTWLQSMHRSPHHAPKHWFLNFDEFLTKKWQCYFSKQGQPSSTDKKYRLACAKAKNLFEEYPSIFELRAQKLKTHLTLAERVPNVCFINYETLAANPEQVISKIAKKFSIETKKSIKNITEDKFGRKEYKKKQYTPISSMEMKLIARNIDWDIESKVGYSLRKSQVSEYTSRGLLARRAKSTDKDPGDVVALKPVSLMIRGSKKV